MTVVLIYEDVFDDDFGEEVFIFSKHDHLFALPTFMWAIFLLERSQRRTFL